MSFILYAVDTAAPWMQFSLINLPIIKKPCAKKRWRASSELHIYWSAIIVLTNRSPLESIILSNEISVVHWAEGTLSFPLPNYWHSLSSLWYMSFFPFPLFCIHCKHICKQTCFFWKAPAYHIDTIPHLQLHYRKCMHPCTIPISICRCSYN